MRIAVDARFVQVDQKRGLSDFTEEVFERLTIQQHTHEFIFFTDQQLPSVAHWPKNVITVVLNPSPTNFLLYKWWYDVKLSFALRKYKADIFIAANGIGSLTTSVKQVLIVRDLTFLHKSIGDAATSDRFYKRHTGRFIKKAAAVVTLSNFVKEELRARYPPTSKEIQPVFSGASHSFQPVEWEAREAIKEQFAEGCEYFFFTSGTNAKSNFLNVLKAFSYFKKWQKTNMKLMVAGTFDFVLKKDLEKLETYKYRQDVIILNGISQIELSKLIAASYAMLYPSFYDGFAIPVLNAMYCEVPVIGSINSSINEVAADAALYADPSKPEGLSEQMKIIFKDEQLRNRLVEATRQRKKLFSWDITAARLWQVVIDTVSE